MKKILLFRHLSTVMKSKSKTAYRQSSTGSAALRSSYPSAGPPTLSTVSTLAASSILNTMYLWTFFHFIAMNDFLHSSVTHIPVVAYTYTHVHNYTSKNKQHDQRVRGCIHRESPDWRMSFREFVDEIFDKHFALGCIDVCMCVSVYTYIHTILKAIAMRDQIFFVKLDGRVMKCLTKVRLRLQRVC